MRRDLAALGAERAAEIAQYFEGRNERRDRSFVRRDLERILRHEQDAAPIRSRQALQEAADNSNTPRDALAPIREQLRRTRPGTVNAQRNPLRWGSAARRSFGDLYRR